jgi:peptidoglycan/xylan/chitin deacetylase (PgdA/CDA1 family)
MRRFLFALFIIGAGALTVVSVQAAQGRRVSLVLSRSSSSKVRSSAVFSKGRSSVASSVSSTKNVPVSTVSILVYHHIRSTKGYAKTTWSWKMSVSPSVFATQMQWLKDKGYHTVSLDSAAQILKTGVSPVSKPVVITFDDNNENVFTDGYPILKKLGLTATWYLITNRFDSNPAFLTKAQIKELAAAGMDLQSHSVTHPWLTSLSEKGQRWELQESRKAIEALSGKPVRHLAYPLTMQNKTVRRVTGEEGYVTATIMDPRPATLKDDLLKLPRIMMTDDTDLKKVLP